MKKKYLISLIIFYVFISSSVLAVASIKKSFIFPKDTSLLNVTVSNGDEFTINIDKRGWYANRFDSKKLAILLRIVDTDKTIFKLRAKEVGDAYVFFSLVDEDKYLHVTIKSKDKNINNNVKVLESKNQKTKSRSLFTPENNKKENNETEKSIIAIGRSESKKSVPKVSGNKLVENTNRGYEKNTNEKLKKINSGGEKSTLVKVPKKNQNYQKIIKDSSINFDKKKKTNEVIGGTSIDTTKTEGAGKNQEKKIIKRKETKNKRKPNKTEEGEKETKIYFIDNKNNKKVLIPVKDEKRDYFEAKRELRKKNYNKAIELFESYINKCENCNYKDKAINSIAKAYSLNGDTEKAFKYYKQVITNEDKNIRIEAIKWIANYYYERKDEKEALNYYEKLFSETKDPKVKKKIGDISYSLGNFQKSIEAYNFCLNNNIIDDEMLFKLASIYDKPGRYHDIEKAYKFYNKIIETYPNSKYYEVSSKRVLFFERNFINLK